MFCIYNKFANGQIQTLNRNTIIKHADIQTHTHTCSHIHIVQTLLLFKALIQKWRGALTEKFIVFVEIFRLLVLEFTFKNFSTDLSLVWLSFSVCTIQKALWLLVHMIGVWGSRGQ